MISDYKKIDLFGKTFIQKVGVKSPFEYFFPVAQQACFLYMLKGEMQYSSEDAHLKVATNHSLLLNCLNSGKQVQESNTKDPSEIVIVTFHPEVLKRIYDKEMPLIFQSNDHTSNQAGSVISNDFLIQKYIEGLLFYFENPYLVNDDILVLKLKEIILLLSQTKQAGIIRTILSQLFSPITYTFKQIIEANLFLPINLGELAEKTNLSVSSFKREFKKLYNDSPANYIKTKKLERAAGILLATDERITDIAFACGFNDLANFTKSFHDKYDITPTNYRLSKLIRNNLK